MNRTPHLIRSLLVAALVASPALALQDTEVAAPPPIPASVEEALELDTSTIVESFAQLSTDDLRTQLSAWLRLLEEHQAALEGTLETTAQERKVSVVGIAVERDQLIDGVEAIASILNERGENVEPTRTVIASIRRIELDRADATFVVPADGLVATTLPVETLKAALRPLTAEQVRIQLDGWMELLRSKSLVVRNVEIAALHADEPEEVAAYNARAVILRSERDHLIERVSAVIDSLETKGADVASERAFVDSVVETPPITRWRAAVTTSMTWLTSMDGGLAMGFSALKAVAAIVLAWFLAGFLAKLARRGMRKVKKASALLSDFVVLSVRRVVILLGLLIGLAQLGVDMTPLIAAIGAAGLVVGLALQGTLSNFASGLLIMTNRPFDVGDLISTSGIDGHVRGMTLLSTCIETLDSRTIFIPNNMVWGDTITNVTANPVRRLDLVFGIAYEDDFKKAQKILTELVEKHPKVMSDPAPVVRVHELGDSSVNFVVRPWVHNDDYWDVHWDLTEAVKEHFDEKGVSIPFPQRDVHLIPVPGEASPAPAKRPELQGEPS